MTVVFWALLIIANVWLASGDRLVGGLWLAVAAAAFLTDWAWNR